VRTDVWSNKHEKGYNSCKNQPSVKSVIYEYAQYLGWPWSEHVYIIPISQMVDFCESYSPFHVCLTIRLSAHLVYAISHLSFVGFYSYLLSLFREIGIICTCSDHGQPRYQIWIKCDKTSCIHKICGWTYGQTNMKRAITLAKINHPWNR
jgi:hypothetical protein